MYDRSVDFPMDYRVSKAGLIYMPYKNIEAERKFSRTYQQKRRLKWRKFLDIQKDKPCMDCNIKYISCVMDFDHRPNETKLFVVSNNSYKPHETIVKEIAKCDVVCSNCHRIRTYRRKQCQILSNGQ